MSQKNDLDRRRRGDVDETMAAVTPVNARPDVA